MKKFFKRALIVLASIVVLLAILFTYVNYQNRKKSPPDTAVYDKNGTKITIEYSRPSKRNRIVFGGLVPFNVVWRTGANEATTFETNKELIIEGKTLPAGKYTLWSIPQKDTWTVIWNSKEYPWGVKSPFNRVASREPEADVLSVQIPATEQGNVTEQFTISFDETPAVVLDWDKTKVIIPFK